MGVSLARLFMILGGVRAWFLFTNLAYTSNPALDDCTSLGDVFTGCTGTIAAVTSFVLGIPATSPLPITLTILLAQTVWVVFTVVEWARGRSV